jgi:hypothetical protein
MKLKWIILILIASMLLTFTGAWIARAASTSAPIISPQIAWWVFGSGGAPATGSGSIQVNDTIGQPIIGLSSASEVALHAGYWAMLEPRQLYLPVIRK